MQFYVIAAVYFLLWFLSLFLVLPFGVRTSEEAGEELVPGQADSAPSNFRPWTIIWRTSVLAAILSALFYFNYVNEWITVDSFDPIFKPPPEALK